MTNDTKAEIVLVAVAAVAVLWLWHNNAQAASSDNSAFPSFNAEKPGTVPGAMLFDIPAPVAGYDPTINLPAWSLPSFTMPMAAGQPGSCNCSQQTDQAFGSNSDMSSWLNTALDPSTILSDVSSWY